MKFFFLFFFLVASAYPQVDYRFSSRGRTYPLTGIFEVDLGYNHLFWGDKTSVLYGYLRPNISYGEMGVYRIATTAFDFYPVSFFKIRAGLSREMSHVLRRDLDCSQIDCQGVIKHQFIESQLLLGAFSYFTSLRYRLNVSKRNDGEHRFLDFEGMMPMQARSDQSQYFQAVVGKNLNDQWNGIFASQFASSQKAKGSSSAHYALGMWLKGPWEIAAGPGLFRSSLYNRDGWGFSSVFWINYNAGDSLALKKR